MLLKVNLWLKYKVPLSLIVHRYIHSYRLSSINCKLIKKWKLKYYIKLIWLNKFYLSLQSINYGSLSKYLKMRQTNLIKTSDSIFKSINKLSYFKTKKERCILIIYSDTNTIMKL